jgi:hypothetical protein
MHLPFDNLSTALAFQLGGNQLNTFETFLNQSVNGIQGAGIITGMTNVSYVVMLIGFLWEVYHSLLSGGDVKGFGKAAAKYVACALVVQAWPQIFTSVNSAFVNAGAWMTGQGGASNVLDTWMNQLQQQYQSDGFQHMWNLITGAMSGLLDAILIFVAYILYPIVTIIFGFFYMLMGSILFIFGPLIVALLPLPPAQRLARSYIEHVFIWNAWPILYGGLGLLVSLVNIGNVQNILNAQSFLGGLNGVEGSLLAGIISIVYSLAIAVIPFMAKSIVTGDVGAAARTMIEAAATALTVGAAAGVGAVAGAGAAGAAGAGGTAGGTGGTSPMGANSGARIGSSNQPAAPTPGPSSGINAAGSAASSGNQPATSISSAPGNQTATNNEGQQDVAAAAESQVSQSSNEQSSAPDSTEETSGADSEAQKAAALNNAQAKQDAKTLQTIQQSGSNPDEDSSVPGSSANEGQDNGQQSSTGSGSVVQAVSQSSSAQVSGSKAAMSGASQRHSVGHGSSRGGGDAFSRGPRLHGGIGTFAAYHAARVATQGAIGVSRKITQALSQLTAANSTPDQTREPQETQESSS